MGSWRESDTKYTHSAQTNSPFGTRTALVVTWSSVLHLAVHRSLEGYLSNTTRVPERGEFVCAEWVYFVSLSLQEPILRATRYLPELVQLQKQMFDFSHRRLDRKEVAKLPVQDYIKSLPG